MAVILGALAVVAAGIMLSVQFSGSETREDAETAGPDADVIMPTKVSRPGCEETDSCYIPSSITIKAGESVTWLNQDSAFHSVTSGTYYSPTDDFDSGHMDPYQSFTLGFDRAGTVEYFCTLHPWMQGRVVIVP